MAVSTSSAAVSLEDHAFIILNAATHGADDSLGVECRREIDDAVTCPVTSRRVSEGRVPPRSIARQERPARRTRSKNGL